MPDSTLTVLVLEDDNADAVLLDRLLSKSRLFDINRTYVPSMAQAKERLSTEAFDLILADYKVVNGYGLNVLTGLKSFAPDTPIILVTGSASGAEFQEMVGEHVGAVLFKNELTLYGLDHAIAGVVWQCRYETAQVELAQLRAKPPRQWYKVWQLIPDLLVKLFSLWNK